MPLLSSIKALKKTLASIEEDPALPQDDPAVESLKTILVRRITELEYHTSSVDADTAERMGAL
jgi:predicted trehalose synthase